MADWGGKVAAWFGVVAAAGGTLAVLVGQTGGQPSRWWAHLAFVALFIISVGAFLMLLLTGVPSLWFAWHGRKASDPAISAPSAQPVAEHSGAAIPPIELRTLLAEAPDLDPAQARTLQEAVAASDRFLTSIDEETRLGRLAPSAGLLLSLSDLELQLGRLSVITVTTSGSAIWGTQVSVAVRQAQDRVRIFRDRHGRGLGRFADGPTATLGAEELSGLRHAIVELKDLIARRYPGLGKPH